MPLRFMRSCVAAIGVIICVGMIAPRESAAQGLGAPGAPMARMGGGRGSVGSPAGSSVPMMSRLGSGRQTPSFGSAAGPTNRYSGRFSSAAVKQQARSMGGSGGGGGGAASAQTIKGQAKSFGRGFGF